MFTFLIVYSIVVTVAFVIAVYSAIRFAKYEFQLESVIEETIDKLTETHNNVSKVLKIPVAQYDPNVVFVVNTIKNARNSIVKIVLNLSELNKKTKKNNDGPTE